MSPRNRMTFFLLWGIKREILSEVKLNEKAVQTCLALHEKVISPKSNIWLLYLYMYNKKNKIE